MKPINVCTMVMKRYDLLREMLESLRASIVRPSRICIIDNGKKPDRLRRALDGLIDPDSTALQVLEPEVSMGIAESWNWFIKNVPEERIITNDDVTFAPTSLEQMATARTFICGTCGSQNVARDTEQEHPGVGNCETCGSCYIHDELPDLVWASGFSCFLIRDTCVKKLGLFDETISPGYGYYEDDDYLQRLDGRGTKPRMATAENVDCGVVHYNSATLKAASHEELLEHHRKFLIAQANYIKKWHLEETFK